MKPQELHTVKRAMVAAATAALEHKRKNPKTSDDDALRHVVQVSDELLREISC